MAFKTRLASRTLNLLDSGMVSKRTSQDCHVHSYLQQQRPASAATIALRASIKYPAHKMVKKPFRFFGKSETAPVPDVPRTIISHKQPTFLWRQKVWTGAKYGWKFVEVVYGGFTVFVLYMAALDSATGEDVRKGRKK